MFKIKVKLDLLSDIDMLLVEKGIRGRICHSLYRYAKANNKCMKDYDQNKELSYIQYQDVNNLYGWAILQKLRVTLRKKCQNMELFPVRIILYLV